ncbi:MAG: tetratricopeptide repeat protein [Actinomycetia bacterium]|nr:tetratricopeptide repeat protein [Actinomycetes bacterium]
MKSRLSSRTLDIALKVVGVLVVVALVYLGYTIWSTQRANEQSKLTTRAVDALIAEVEKNPKDPAARILLAQALAAAGRTNEAITQYQNALTLDKNNVAALQGLGLIAMSRQDWKTAEGYWRRIIDELSSGQYAGVDERLEQADYYLGLTLIELHDYEEAVRYLKEALRIRRDASDTHYALAVAYKELGSKENQRKELETALAFDPLMPEANYEMALLLLEDGDEAGAAELLRRSVDNAPGRAEPLAELEKLGPFEKRLAAAKELLATDKKKALLEARVAVALEPKNLEAARLVARLLDEIGKPEDATAAWERVVSLAPNDPEATTALERLGKK